VLHFPISISTFAAIYKAGEKLINHSLASLSVLCVACVRYAAGRPVESTDIQMCGCIFPEVMHPFLNYQLKWSKVIY
jgi:E3 ubiquitin-protein ligase DOA10